MATNLIPLSVSDINTTVNHEPRILDVRLAEALGFDRPRDIRKLVERHREGLNRFGEVCATVAQTTRRGGRPGQEFWLNERQALYLCTKSETPNATEITIQMVEIFYRVKNGSAEQPIGPVDLLAEYADRSNAGLERSTKLTIKEVQDAKLGVLHYLKTWVVSPILAKMETFDLRFRASYERDKMVLAATGEQAQSLARMEGSLGGVLRLAHRTLEPETLIPSEWVSVTGVYRLAGVTGSILHQRSLSARIQRSLDAFCIDTYRQADIRNSGFGRKERIWRIAAAKAWLKHSGRDIIAMHMAKYAPIEQGIIQFPVPSK